MSAEEFVDALMAVRAAATPSLSEAVKETIRQAVLAEREACAKIADECADPDCHGQAIATTIRARGDV